MSILVDNSIDKEIAFKLKEDEKKRSAEHKSTGKLAASRLPWPVQWQILHYLGVEKKPFDDYTLRKFKRGRDVEDWLIGNILNLVESQKFLEYRNTVGFADTIVDTKLYENPVGVIPIEIKSTANSKFKWIKQNQEPDDGHILQGCLYALAEDSSHFGVTYVASDDYRTLTFILETKWYKQRVDTIIDTYQEQVDKREVPVFEPLYSWQKSQKYSPYPEWADLTEKEILEKMDRLGISFPKK